MTCQIIPFPALRTPELRRLSAIELGMLLGMLIGLVAFWSVVLWMLL